MTRRGGSATAVALALIAAGATYFVWVLGFVRTDAVTIAFAVVGGAALVYAVARLDPAWILTAGIVTTMFAGHWDQLGLSAVTSPHRVLIVVGLLAVILRAPGARDRPSIEFRSVHYVLAAALAYALVSAIFAGTLDESNGRFLLLDEFGLLPFTLFLVAPVAFYTERQRRILLGSLVAVGFYLAVTALFEKLNLRGLVVPSYINDPNIGTHFDRARGPFVEAGADGLALFACAIAAGMGLILWRRPWARLAAAVVVILAPVGLLLTVTRSVWLAGVVGALVAVVTTAGLRRLLVPIVAVAVTGVLIALAVIPGLASQASERRKNEGSVQERENTTAAGLRMIADRPLIGFGWDRGNDFIDPYFRLDPNIPLKGANAGFHNVYLQYGVALGVLGLGIWLLGGGMAAAGAMKRRGPPSLRPWEVGLKAYLPAWGILALSYPASYSFSTFLLWTWMGVATGLPARQALLDSEFENGGPPGGNGHVPTGNGPGERAEPTLA
jgi:putative inorganic carbon (HCO3(-)) transporter